MLFLTSQYFLLLLAALGWAMAVALGVLAWRWRRELMRRRRAAAGSLGALEALEARDYKGALARANDFLPASSTWENATIHRSNGSGMNEAATATPSPSASPSATPQVASTEEVAQAFQRTVLLLEAADREGQIARRELEDVLSSLQDSVLVVDDEARLRFLNAAAQVFFHVQAEHVLGARILEALPSFGLESVVRDALRDGQHHSREVALYAPGHATSFDASPNNGSANGSAIGTNGNVNGSTDGSDGEADGSWKVDRRIEGRFEGRREVLLRVAPVRRSDGVVSGAVAIVQDLTELRRLERVRRDFVANASHELRTPIANIRAAAETILDSADDPSTVQRFLPRLVDEAGRLSRLVSDLLDLARVDSGNEIARTPIDLSRIAREVADRLREKAQAQGIEIACLSPTSVWVMGEAGGLDQVAFNLLDNALMYTPAGGRVEIDVTPPGAPGGHVRSARARRAAQDGDAADVLTMDAEVDGEVESHSVAVLRVSDTGIGIPSADLPRIFERFYRVDKARSRSQGGTGLGLAIVKHIVDRHGGHIRVESEAGSGTTFHVFLPTE